MASVLSASLNRTLPVEPVLPFSFSLTWYAPNSWAYRYFLSPPGTHMMGEERVEGARSEWDESIIILLLLLGARYQWEGGLCPRPPSSPGGRGVCSDIPFGFQRRGWSLCTVSLGVSLVAAPRVAKHPWKPVTKIDGGRKTEKEAPPRKGPSTEHVPDTWAILIPVFLFSMSNSGSLEGILVMSMVMESKDN